MRRWSPEDVASNSKGGKGTLLHIHTRARCFPVTPTRLTAALHSSLTASLPPPQTQPSSRAYALAAVPTGCSGVHMHLGLGSTVPACQSGSVNEPPVVQSSEVVNTCDVRAHRPWHPSISLEVGRPNTCSAAAPPSGEGTTPTYTEGTNPHTRPPRLGLWTAHARGGGWRWARDHESRLSDAMRIPWS